MPNAKTDYGVEFERALIEHFSYDPESGLLVWIKKRSNMHVGEAAGSPDGKGYLQVQFMGHKMRAHRICWFLYYGNWPAELDHWDAVGINNSLYNLREVSHQTNSENRRRANANNLAGLLGVKTNNSSYLKPFSAIIKIDGISKTLGHFDYPEDAHFAYIEAKRRLHSGCTI